MIAEALELRLQEAREVGKEAAKRREDRKDNHLWLQVQSEAML